MRIILPPVLRLVVAIATGALFVFLTTIPLLVAAVARWYPFSAATLVALLLLATTPVMLVVTVPVLIMR